MYDGRKTVNVELDDLRVGDIVEYSYSVSGNNPVFQNKLSGRADLQYGVPVDRIFVRVMAPLERPLRFANKNTRLEPQLTVSGGMRDYRWNLVSMPGLRVEKDAPAGFDPQASSDWTEFGDWAAVVRWALPLYRHGAPGPTVRAEIARIEAAAKSPAERLIAVLQLVQRDIRYLGVEIGAGTHAPASPDVVFKRRFGDCKDKATLVVAMLDALGIEAAPALVHSDGLKDGELSSPHAFNHVIVRARVDGKTYWLDPTRSEQQGDLANLAQPDFGMALVLDENSTALVKMASRAAARRSIRSSFDLRGAYDAPVGYVISTTVEGAEADRMRARLATVGSADIEMEYLNFYARRYPGIKSAKPMEVKDDLVKNKLALTEHYQVAGFWQRKGKKKRYEAYVGSAEIRSRLAVPDVLKRIAPLKLEFPEEVEEITEVALPESWDIKDEAYKVSDPAFEFQHAAALSPDGMTLTMTDRYRALADRVHPGAVAAYAGRVRAADDEVGMSLYRGDSSAPAAIKAHIEWRAVLVMVLFFALVLFSLLLHTSPEGHRSTDLRLLFGFVGISVALVIGAMLITKGSHVALAVLATLYALHLVMRKISNGAPASHWIYPLAHPAVAGIHSGFFRVLALVLRFMPALLVTACALYLIFA
jgi:transglutaminase-like putative cysteine protease